jgi:hypothetical protein
VGYSMNDTVRGIPSTIDLESWFENQASLSPDIYSDIYHLNLNGRLGMPILWDSEEDVFIFFILGTLLNDKGGNLVAKAGYIRNRLENLKRLDFSICAESHRLKFETVSRKLVKKFEQFNDETHPRDMLVKWWSETKLENDCDLDKAGYAIVREIYDWSYPGKTGNLLKIMPVKSFWIARELKIHGIWPDIPNKYCCIPDSIVRKNLFSYVRQNHLFKGSEKDFNKFFSHFDISRSVSEIVEDFIKKHAIDTSFPFDMPFFKSELNY